MDLSMKYIAYCRKSTDEKDKQLLSIEAQIVELEEYAKKEHLEVVDYVTETKTAKVPGQAKSEREKNKRKRVRWGATRLSWRGREAAEPNN